MKMKICKIIISILIVANFASAERKFHPDLEINCPEEEFKRAVKDAKNCQKNVEKRFLQLTPSKQTLCHALEESSVICNHVFVLCLDDHTLKKLQKLTLRIQINRYRNVFGIGEKIFDCEIANSTAKTEMKNAKTSLCESNKVNKVVQDYHKCAKDASDSLRERYRNSDSSILTRKKLVCNTLDKILNSCYSRMSECFEERKLTKMRERQMDFTATMFYRFADMIGFNIRTCPVYYEPEIRNTAQKKKPNLITFSALLILCILKGK